MENTKVPKDFDILMGSVPTKASKVQNGPGASSSSYTVSSSSQEFQVTFRVQFKTEMGQSLCLVGSLDEIGRWKNYLAHMKWTEGHFWTLTLKIRDPVF